MAAYYQPKLKFWRAEVIKRMAVFVVVVLLIFVAAGLSAFAYFSKDLPNPERLTERQLIQSTRIYDREGKVLLFDIHNEKKRTMVNLEDIPAHISFAAIAAEDENFYKHNGFDLKGITRAFFTNLKEGKIKQGGSTITQQLVKNAILTPERTITRKIKELILSWEIERRFTKEDILQLYLNEIPYGSNVYGIEAAAQSIFNTPATDLTISQSALLASLPKAPTYYSPYGLHKEELMDRHDKTLKKMFDLGYIYEEDYEQALNEELIFSTPNPIKAPHFVMYVKEQLVEMFGDRLVEEGGLKVTTTLDIELQQLAEDIIVEESQKNLTNYDAKNSALVALNPNTGEILAMVGSRDYFDVNNDGNVNVTLRPRQPGSSMKPFAYATAFKKGYTPETVVFDLETNFGEDGQGNEYIPGNYDDKFRGPLTMRQCIQMSVNVCSVKTLYLAGIGDTLKTAKDLGLETFADESRFGLSLVLGGGEVKLLEHVNAYGTFATSGVHYPNFPIVKVEDQEGNVIFKQEIEGKQAIDEEIARTITDVLSDNKARAPVFGSNSNLYLGARPVAAKTGTTSEYRDAWLVGYTPQLAVGVWTGNNDNTPMKKDASGGRVAGPIWNRFMREALEGEEIIEFIPPVGNSKPKIDQARAVKIDKITGKLATDLTPPHLVEEKVFQEVHSVLYYVDPKSDQFPLWEQPVIEWASERNYNSSAPTEYDDVHTLENRPIPKIINLTKPGNNNLRVDVSVEAKLEMKQVDFFFDGNLVATDSTAPYSAFFRMPSTTPGSHILSVKAYDVVDNIGDLSQTVSLP